MLNALFFLTWLLAEVPPGPSGPPAAMPPPIAYTLSFPAPETHYLEVELLLPALAPPPLDPPPEEQGGHGFRELAMAVWAPGSYLVREFSRNVESLTAHGADGGALAVQKTAKNRWRIEGAGRGPVRVRYRLYCREMSVRTSYVGGRFALLNGAATFITLAEALEEGSAAHPHAVNVELPSGWSRSISPLPPFAAGNGEEGHRYLAGSFDELVDSPLYAGNPAVYEEEVEGVLHRLVNEGEGGSFDGPRAAADMAALARIQRQLWGSFPYPQYTFFNLLTETGGGLEHARSTVLMASRLATRSREKYLDWLGLASHELFHAWNGKRLRPLELGPFDYEAEAYTESLWAVEGITSYYDDLLVHRAGLSTRKELFKELSKTLERLDTTPGRLVQPLAESSFDAWIKHYRRDENSINRGISYYAKGAVVAWLLDVEIRRATGGEKSLDDALRLAYQRFSGERGYTREGFEATAAEVAGADLTSFFRRALDGTEDLDLAVALSWLGLRLSERRKENGGEDAEARVWLGAKVEGRDGALVVTEVLRGSPAFTAGLSAEDEILAVDGYRVRPGGWEEHLKSYRPGDQAELLIARRQVLSNLPLTFGEKPKEAWKLEVDPEATAEQKARLDAWLGPEREGNPGRESVSPR